MYIRNILLSLSLCIAAGGSAAAAEHPDLDVVILGDSNTWIGGDDCSAAKGWNHWFAKAFAPATCRSYARSGATWSNTGSTLRDTGHYSEVLHDRNVVYNQVARLTEAADRGEQPEPEVIMILAGTNDAWFGEKHPHMYDKSVAEVFADTSSMHPDLNPAENLTLAGAVRQNCELLMRRFPEAMIVLVAPVQSAAFSYEKLRRVTDILDECGRRMAIPVIHIDGAGVYAPREATSRTFTSDGTHTSEAGARRIGNLLARQLDTILPF